MCGLLGAAFFFKNFGFFPGIVAFFNPSYSHMRNARRNSLTHAKIFDVELPFKHGPGKPKPAFGQRFSFLK